MGRHRAGAKFRSGQREGGLDEAEQAQKERKSADISANTLIRALPSLHRLAEKEGGCRSWLPEQLCRSHASED